MNASPRLAGIFTSKMTKAVIIPPKMTAICHFWVNVTAWLPPATVYMITSNPLKMMVRSSRQPSTVERMMAGA